MPKIYATVVFALLTAGCPGGDTGVSPTPELAATPQPAPTPDATAVAATPADAAAVESIATPAPPDESATPMALAAADIGGGAPVLSGKGAQARSLPPGRFDFAADGGFESGTPRGWGVTGGAFDGQPLPTDFVARGETVPPGITGKFYVASHRTVGKAGKTVVRGDDFVGTMTSAAFPITGGTLAFSIAGGKSNATRVELLVDGVAVQTASGADSDTPAEVRWPLAAYSGKEGRIALIDDSGKAWGRLIVDDFRIEP
jgi:hypothetical protein